VSVVCQPEAGAGHGTPLLLEAGERRVAVGAAEVDRAEATFRGPLHHLPVEDMVGAQRECALVAAVVDELDRVAEHVVHATGHVAPGMAHKEQPELVAQQLLRQAQLAVAARQRTVLSHRAHVHPVKAAQVVARLPGPELELSRLRLLEAAEQVVRCLAPACAQGVEVPRHRHHPPWRQLLQFETGRWLEAAVVGVDAERGHLFLFTRGLHHLLRQGVILRKGTTVREHGDGAGARIRHESLLAEQGQHARDRAVPRDGQVPGMECIRALEDRGPRPEVVDRCPGMRTHIGVPAGIR
jgi:hypothetical protein